MHLPASLLSDDPRKERRVFWLTTLMTVYMVLPFGDLPYLGISLSAPIAAFLALELLPVAAELDLRVLRPWIVLCMLCLLGAYASLAGNAFQGNIEEITAADVKILVQFAFWLLVLVVTSCVVSHLSWERALWGILGAGVMAVAVLRFTEVVLYHNWGGSTTVFMSRNVYGWMMSTFAPFAVLFLAQVPKRWRFVTSVGWAVLLVAVVGNLSRSTWLALSVALVVTGCVAVLAGGRILGSLAGVAAAVAIVVMAVLALPSSVTAPITERFESLDNLDKEKSYQLRVALIDKGLKLYEQNPLFGAGLGRFGTTYAPVRMPEVLAHLRDEALMNRSSHNSYVALLAETGLAGCVPYGCLMLALLGGSIWATIGHAHRNELWAFAVLGSLVSMSVHLWSLSGLMGTAPWFVYGLAAGMVQREILMRRIVR